MITIEKCFISKAHHVNTDVNKIKDMKKVNIQHNGILEYILRELKNIKNVKNIAIGKTFNANNDSDVKYRLVVNKVSGKSKIYLDMCQTSYHYERGKLIALCIRKVLLVLKEL